MILCEPYRLVLVVRLLIFDCITACTTVLDNDSAGELLDTGGLGGILQRQKWPLWIELCRSVACGFVTCAIRPNITGIGGPLMTIFTSQLREFPTKVATGWAKWKLQNLSLHGTDRVLRNERAGGGVPRLTRQVRGRRCNFSG